MITLTQYIYENINESLITEAREKITLSEGDKLYTFFLEPKNENSRLFEWIGDHFVKSSDWTTTDKIVEFELKEVRNLNGYLELKTDRTWIVDKDAYKYAKFDFIDRLIINYMKRSGKEAIEVADDGHIVNLVCIVGNANGDVPVALKFFTSKEAAQKAKDKWLTGGELRAVEAYFKANKKASEERSRQWVKNFRKSTGKIVVPLDKYLEYVKYATGKNIWDVIQITPAIDGEEGDNLKTLQSKKFWDQELAKKKKPITIFIKEPTLGFYIDEEGSEVRHYFELDGMKVNVEPMLSKETTVDRSGRDYPMDRRYRWAYKLTGKLPLEEWLKKNE